MPKTIMDCGQRGEVSRIMRELDGKLEAIVNEASQAANGKPKPRSGKDEDNTIEEYYRNMHPDNARGPFI